MSLKPGASPIDAVVAVAMDSEAVAYLNLAVATSRQPLLDSPDLSFGGAKAWAVRAESCSLLVVRCGIGLANAAAASALALHLTRAPLLVSGGSAGGLATDIEVGDVVVSTATRYGQVDVTAFGYEPGQVPGEPAQFQTASPLVEVAVAAGARAGEVLSNDVFVMSHNVDDFRGRFPAALATDMESAAHAQIAHHFGTQFVAIRGISDLCGPSADKQNHLDAERVSANAAAVTERVVGVFASASEVMQARAGSAGVD